MIIDGDKLKEDLINAYGSGMIANPAMQVVLGDLTDPKLTSEKLVEIANQTGVNWSDYEVPDDDFSLTRDPNKRGF